MKKIRLHVLDESMKFDRKIYGVFGWPLWRPVLIKSLLYFIVAFAVLVILDRIPLVKDVVGIPRKAAVLYLLLPALFSYMLTDVGTEHRSPLHFLRSVVGYGFRKLQGHSYYRGKTLSRPGNYKFHSFLHGGYLTYKEPNERSTDK